MNNENVLTFEEYKEKKMNYFVQMLENAKKVLNTDKVFLDGKEMSLEDYIRDGYKTYLASIELRDPKYILQKK